MDCWVNIAWTLPIGVFLGVPLFLSFSLTCSHVLAKPLKSICHVLFSMKYTVKPTIFVIISGILEPVGFIEPNEFGGEIKHAVDQQHPIRQTCFSPATP